MQEHKQIEATAQAQYACPFPDCQKGFSTPYRLRRHVEGTVKHQGNAARRFPCPHCKKLFPYQFNIPLHIKRVHKIPCLSSEPRKEIVRPPTAKQKRGDGCAQNARCEDSPDLNAPSTSASSQDSHPDVAPCFGGRTPTCDPYEPTSVQTSIDELFAVPEVVRSASSCKGDSSRSSSFDPTSASTLPSTMMTSPLTWSPPVMSPSTSSPNDAREVAEMEGNVIAYLDCSGLQTMLSVEAPFNSHGANGAHDSSVAPQVPNHVNGSSIHCPAVVNNHSQASLSDYNHELVMQVINETFQTHQFMMASYTAPQQSYQQPYGHYQPQQHGQMDSGMNDQLSLDCLPASPMQQTYSRQRLQWHPNLYEEFCRLANEATY